jgi:hypothetical protein
MKKILSILLILSSLVPLASAQTATNLPPELLPAPVTTAVTFLTTPSTNWYGATYGIYSLDTDDYGVGVAAFYKVNDFVGAFLAMDELGGQLYMPSGNFQLSLPVKLLGQLDAVPFVRTGIATPLGDSDDPTVAGIFGAGWAVRLPDSAKWYVPKDLVFDIEKWTNRQGLQVRAGAIWRF